MDSRHTADIFKHSEKQNELLMESYRSMSHELHKILVEEEMLMHKFYKIISAHGKIKRILEDGSNVSDDDRVEDSTALVISSDN